MITLKEIKDNIIIENISKGIKEYEYICSVEMHSILIDKKISTSIAIDIINRAIKKKYKEYKLISSYTDYSGKNIDQEIEEKYYIGFITINKPYKSYSIGFYKLEELKDYRHEELSIDEMTIDTILR